jgi:hypothetical protein
MGSGTPEHAPVQRLSALAEERTRMLSREDYPPQRTQFIAREPELLQSHTLRSSPHCSSRSGGAPASGASLAKRHSSPQTGLAPTASGCRVVGPTAARWTDSPVQLNSKRAHLACGDLLEPEWNAAPFSVTRSSNDWRLLTAAHLLARVTEAPEALRFSVTIRLQTSPT